MNELGFDRIWDTGNLKYELILWNKKRVAKKCNPSYYINIKLIISTLVSQMF
jgi:hypothetical protein